MRMVPVSRAARPLSRGGRKSRLSIVGLRVYTGRGFVLSAAAIAIESSTGAGRCNDED